MTATIALGNIARSNCTDANNWVIYDGDAVQYDRARPQPDIASDSDRLSNTGRSGRRRVPTTGRATEAICYDCVVADLDPDSGIMRLQMGTSLTADNSGALYIMRSALLWTL